MGDPTPVKIINTPATDRIPRDARNWGRSMAEKAARGPEKSWWGHDSMRKDYLRHIDERNENLRGMTSLDDFRKGTDLESLRWNLAKKAEMERIINNSKPSLASRAGAGLYGAAKVLGPLGAVMGAADFLTETPGSSYLDEEEAKWNTHKARAKQWWNGTSGDTGPSIWHEGVPNHDPRPINYLTGTPGGVMEVKF
jgi:hypothetical protein